MYMLKMESQREWSFAEPAYSRLSLAPPRSAETLSFHSLVDSPRARTFTFTPSDLSDIVPMFWSRV